MGQALGPCVCISLLLLGSQHLSCSLISARGSSCCPGEVGVVIGRGRGGVQPPAMLSVALKPPSSQPPGVLPSVPPKVRTTPGDPGGSRW